MRAPSRWRERALCRSVDPEVFFPTAEPGTAQYAAEVATAKAVCAACPVRAECLAEALARIPYGIAGGLTPDERRGGRRPAAPVVRPPVVRRSRQRARDHEREVTGLVLLAAGRPPGEVAAECGVSERTVGPWAARHRLIGPVQQVEGSGGGNRAPLRISHASPLAGTRAEGNRG